MFILHSAPNLRSIVFRVRTDTVADCCDVDIISPIAIDDRSFSTEEIEIRRPRRLNWRWTYVLSPRVRLLPPAFLARISDLATFARAQTTTRGMDKRRRCYRQVRQESILSCWLVLFASAWPCWMPLLPPSSSWITWHP